MSNECGYCGFRDPMPFKCKFCGRYYCYSHRMPEVHSCTGLAAYKEKVYKGEKFDHMPGYSVKKPQSSFFKSFFSPVSVIANNYSLAILVAVLISFVIQTIAGKDTYFSYFALYPLDILSRPWTLITHIFLHNGPWHLLFNMLTLFFFGPELERRIGGKSFLIVFFASGIVAAIGYSLWTVFVIGSKAAAVGASGALLGIFACLAVIAPQIEVALYFFIPMKITFALIFFALFDLVFIGSGDAIARSAHLSGIVAGVLLGKKLKHYVSAT